METRLVESAQGGDIESFGKLCSSYYYSMVAIAYAVLADHHLAQDAAQEAFARALVNLNKLRRKVKFAPWLGQICRNVAKDMAKSKARQINTDDFSKLADSRKKDCDTDIVKQAIANLSASERELVILRYYNDLSYEQMSKVLGISKPAINGRLNRAKKELAKYLQRNGLLEK